MKKFCNDYRGHDGECRYTQEGRMTGYFQRCLKALDCSASLGTDETECTTPTPDQLRAAARERRRAAMLKRRAQAHEDTVVVNIFAGPGSGKSTLACGLMHALKSTHESVELVTEFAKDLIWREHGATFRDQLYVFATQRHHIELLRGKVQIVVTDSPALQAACYTPDEEKRLRRFILQYGLPRESDINVFLQRHESFKFRAEGRHQRTVEEARVQDKKIRDMLLKADVKFMDWEVTEPVGKLAHIIARRAMEHRARGDE